jgi:hypothetical protein
MEHYNLTREDESLNIHDPHLFSYLISKVRTLMFWRKDSKKEDETKVHVYFDVIESLPSRFDDIIARLNKVSHIYNSFIFFYLLSMSSIHFMSKLCFWLEVPDSPPLLGFSFY